MASGKKVIMVIGALPDSLVNFRFHLLKAMVDRGHTVIACAARRDALSGIATSDIAARLAQIGVSYYAIPLERTGVNPLHDLHTLLAIYTLCRRLSPAVLLCYTAKPIIYGSLAGNLAGVPAIHALISGLGVGISSESTHSGLAAAIVRTLYRLALAKNRTAIFQNPDDRAALAASGLLAPQTTTALVNGSGVDIAHFSPSPIPPAPITFLLIARLLGEKGVREYARAAEIVKAHYPETRFVLVGPIDRHPDAVPETEVLFWQQAELVAWAGPVSDVRSFLASSSVYVLPSYHEGTPRTVLEAMATGRPIITTDVPGCRETVIDGDNGFLVPVKDAEALASAMEWFITHPALMAKMGQRSRQMAEDKYDVHQVNDAMLHALELQ